MRPLISKPGWLTLDSSGAVYYHDSEPYVKRTTVESFDPDRPNVEVLYSWYSHGTINCLGLNDRLLLPLQVNQPLKVTFEIWTEV